MRRHRTTRRLGLLPLAAALAVAPAAAAAPSDWSGPVGLPSSTGAVLPQAGAAGDGGATVLWSDTEGRLTTVRRSRTGEVGRPQMLASVTEQGALRAETLAVGRDGTAVVVWPQYSSRSPHYRILAAVRRPGGLFGKAVHVGNAVSVWRAAPTAAVSREGVIAVGWSRDDAPQMAIAMPGDGFGSVQTLKGWGWQGPSVGTRPGQFVLAFNRSGRLYGATSRHVTSTRDDDAPIAVYIGSAGMPYRLGAPRRLSSGQGLDPALAPNASHMTVAWRDGEPDGEGVGRGAIWATTTDTGGEFTFATKLTPDASLGREPVLASGPRRRILATWSPQGTATTWVARRRLSGAWNSQLVAPADAGGTAPGIAIDDGTADSAAVAIATVAYSRREGDQRVLAVRSDRLGTVSPAETLLSGPGTWTDVTAAAGGRTTVVVAARPGEPLTLFSRG